MKKIFYLLFNNLNFKIIAILLAVIIWILAGLFRTNKVTITIPIEYTNLTPEFIITETSVEKVKLNLEGKGSDFIRLSLTPPKYKLNLNNAKYGINRYRLTDDDITRLSPITVKSITPDLIEIQTDYLDSSKFVVTVPYRIDQTKGIYITKTIVSDTVILYGPESRMPFIKELYAESLFITSYSSSQIARKLRVFLPEPKIYHIKPDSVIVTAEVEKEDTKTLENIALKIINPAKKKILVQPDSARITVRGPSSLVQTLTTTDIKVNLDLSKNESGEYKLPVEITLPRSVYLVKCDPPLFEVKIQ